MSTTTEQGYVPTLDYLAWVVRQARIDGEILVGGGGATRERQTWGRAVVEYDRSVDLQRYAGWQTIYRPEEEDWAEARAMLDYFRAQSPEEQQSDYLLDLVVLLRDDQIRRDRLALAASGLTVYRRALERQAREAGARKQRQASRHLGMPGERRTVIATVAEKHDRAGRLTIYRLVTDEGHALTYFGFPQQLNSGWAYQLNVTIGAHDEYKGEQRTKLKSCAVVSVVEEGSHPGPKVGARDDHQ